MNTGSISLKNIQGSRRRGQIGRHQRL
uniref:Uncharacterized protein n=1 Tax=Lepeophtheirus salmonis TaxID=72036 RepID=A0A0K2VBX9_LEPSM